jgi:hypothetical protein
MGAHACAPGQALDALRGAGQSIASAPCQRGIKWLLQAHLALPVSGRRRLLPGQYKVVVQAGQLELLETVMVGVGTDVVVQVARRGQIAGSKAVIRTLPLQVKKPKSMGNRRGTCIVLPQQQKNFIGRCRSFYSSSYGAVLLA